MMYICPHVRCLHLQKHHVNSNHISQCAREPQVVCVTFIRLYELLVLNIYFRHEFFFLIIYFCFICNHTAERDICINPST